MILKLSKNLDISFSYVKDINYTENYLYEHKLSKERFNTYTYTHTYFMIFCNIFFY